MGQMKTLGTTATKVETHGASTIVTYHNTDVVCFDSASVLLKTGGETLPFRDDFAAFTR